MPVDLPFENPVCLRLLRGGRLEAQHRGAWTVVREGQEIARVGDCDRSYFMRSASKFFQAVPTLAAGAEERFSLGDREIGLMCASHGGEPMHVAVAGGMLERGGLSMHDLRCGPHAPLHGPSAAILRAGGARATRLHNNCSGKHAGMMLGSIALGVSPQNYTDPDHPIQRRIIDTMLELCEIERDQLGVMIDGCSAPTFFCPLTAAARAYSAFAAPSKRLGPTLAAVSERTFRALAADPMMIAGHDRFCTAVIEATNGRVVSKVGADGFYGAMERTTGTGIALHIDDGSSQAGERLLTAILLHLRLINESEAAALDRYNDPVRRNHAGLEVGAFEMSL